MPDRANDLLPKAPDLETAQAIARGRELVKQAQQLRDEAERQIEDVQATLEQADCALDRANQILRDSSESRVPSGTGSSSDTEEA